MCCIKKLFCLLFINYRYDSKFPADFKKNYIQEKIKKNSD